jgi:hypothetical protein
MPHDPSYPVSSPKVQEAIRPYSDEELSTDKDMDEKIEKLMKFFDEHGITYDKFVSPSRDFMDTSKKAYPNYEHFAYVPGQHDTQKWLMAVKDMYYKKKRGVPFEEAVRQTTGGWKKMETYDFLNWLKFYEEGAHMKYKFAQVWYENGQPGYFLHIKQDTQQVATPTVDVDAAREEVSHQEEKRQIIEKQRAKIIGRLDSAEKLLRSPDGQIFAGPELEGLMEAIYGLKKKVQLVNKLSVSTRLYEDMIVRESNVLRRKGFVKAASLLYSVAQTPGADAVLGPDGQATGGAVPPPAPPPDPSGAGQSGTMVGLPATTPGTNPNTPVDGAAQTESQPSAAGLQPPAGPPGTAQSSPAIMPQEDPQPAGIKEFMENMNDGNKTDADDLEVTDNLEVDDPEQQLMVSEAQAMPTAPGGPPPATLEDVPMTDTPPPAPLNPVDPIPAIPEAKPVAAPVAPAGEEPLEVTEDDIPQDTPSGGSSGSLESKLDSTFESVTMEEIVAELKDISQYYKVREMPRRLARLDMMFDSKGISAYFPSLAEAQRSALEANNYISTRIDDILSKVSGSLASKDVGAKLKEDQDKEKARKQMRKDQENAELEGGGAAPAAGKETPQVEMGELAPPAGAPAKAPVAPRPLG